jgi:hypothetical protein
MSKELGTLTEQLFDQKQRKKALNAELSELNGEIRLTERGLLREMQEQELWEAGNQNIKITRSSKTVAEVVNWDQFYEYIYENKAGYMLERRPSLTACREMFDEGDPIPGVDPRTFEEVRTRSK